MNIDEHQLNTIINGLSELINIKQDKIEYLEAAAKTTGQMIDEHLAKHQETLRKLSDAESAYKQMFQLNKSNEELADDRRNYFDQLNVALSIMTEKQFNKYEQQLRKKNIQ